MSKPTPKKRKQPSGGAKLRAAGKRAVLLGLFPEDYAILQQAAKREGRKVTNFVWHHAMLRANELVHGRARTVGEVYREEPTAEGFMNGDWEVAL